MFPGKRRGVVRGTREIPLFAARIDPRLPDLM
jgi:hypothetical protein